MTGTAQTVALWSLHPSRTASSAATRAMGGERLVVIWVRHEGVVAAMAVVEVV